MADCAAKLSVHSTHVAGQLFMHQAVWSLSIILASHDIPDGRVIQFVLYMLSLIFPVAVFSDWTGSSPDGLVVMFEDIKVAVLDYTS
jgi:hypothetical protein